MCEYKLEICQDKHYNNLFYPKCLLIFNDFNLVISVIKATRKAEKGTAHCRLLETRSQFKVYKDDRYIANVYCDHTIDMPLYEFGGSLMYDE